MSSSFYVKWEKEEVHPIFHLIVKTNARATYERTRTKGTNIGANGSISSIEKINNFEFFSFHPSVRWSPEMRKSFSISQTTKPTTIHNNRLLYYFHNIKKIVSLTNQSIMNTTSININANPFIFLLIAILAQQVTTSLGFSAFTKTIRINPQLHFDFLSLTAKISTTTVMALRIHTNKAEKVRSHRGCNPLGYSE